MTVALVQVRDEATLDADRPEGGGGEEQGSGNVMEVLLTGVLTSL